MKKLIFLTILLILNLAPAYPENFHGTIAKTPDSIQKIMQNHTWQPGCPVPISDLSYLKLSYWGFDGKVHTGDMIVNKALAVEVVDIFSQLFRIKFPIERMEVVSSIRAKGSTENAVNDTNSFRCDHDGDRSGMFSMHAYGIAIDINPTFNPGKVDPKLVKGGVVPRQSKRYLNRQLGHKGMIHPGDPAFM